MMSSDAHGWSSRSGSSAATYFHQQQQPFPAFGESMSLTRCNSAVDMRQLTRALVEAREGTGQVREILLTASFRPRLPGLTKIVSKLSKEYSWRKALEVFETVEEMGGLQADTALTNSAISACDKGGRWQKALEIFEKMGAMGLYRDAITYSATISALAKGKHWHAALQVFDHMQANNVEADVVTCCSLINALERGGQWQFAEKLFLEMCTVQEHDARLLSPPPPPPTTTSSSPTVTAAVNSPVAHSSITRSYTSPSSMLLSMSGGSSRGSGGGGSLPSVALLGSIEESGAVPAELDLKYSLTAQRGALGRVSSDCPLTPPTTPTPTTIASSDKKKLATIDGEDDGKLINTTTGADADVDELVSAFAGRATISSSDGGKDPGMDLAVAAVANAASTDGADGGCGSNLNDQHLHLSSAATSDAFNQVQGGGVTHEQQLLSISAPAFTSSSTPGFNNTPPPPPPPPQQQQSLSRLQRGMVRRANSISTSAQVAAAAHLHRAMSSFTDLEGAAAAATTSSAFQDDASSTHSSRSGSTPVSAANTPTSASVFNFSHAARVAPNRVCCNALLAAYARAKPHPQLHKCLHLLQAMWTGGPTLRPDTVSYNTVLKACVNALQLGKAMDVFEEMRRKGVDRNATTFSTIITAASDARDASALHQIGEWLTAEPSLDIQSACMNVYVEGLVKVGQWEEAVGRFHSMLSLHGSLARPSPATFNTIMAGHMARGNYREVRATFDAVRAVGLSPNIVAFNTLLAALAALGEWRESVDVLNLVFAAASEGVHPNTATFNAVLAALAKGAAAASSDPGHHHHQMLASQAVQVFQQMQVSRASAAPDAATFHAMITIMDALGNSEQVVAIHTMMATEGLIADPPTAHKVVAAAIATGQASTALQLMQPSSSSQLHSVVPVDAAQLSDLLGACVNGGAWETAQQLCAAAQMTQGQNIAAPMYNYVLNSALDAGELAFAMQLLTAMESGNVDVDAVAAHKILRGGSSSADGGTTTTTTAANPAFYSSPLNGSTTTTTAATSAFYSSPLSFHPQPSTTTDHNTSPPHKQHHHHTTPPLFPSTPEIAAPTGTTFSRRSRSPDSPGVLSKSRSYTHMDAPANMNASFRVIDGMVPQFAAKFSSQLVTLADANAALAALSSQGDVSGCAEVVNTMKIAGITPDVCSYHRLLEALIASGDGKGALDVCRETHAAGVLRHLPVAAASSSSSSSSKVMDLRGCDVKVATTVLLLWLTEKMAQSGCSAASSASSFHAQQQQQQFSLWGGGSMKILFGPLTEEDRCANVDWHAVRAEMHSLLTTGRTSLPAFVSIMPPTVLPPHAVRFGVEGPCALLEVHLSSMTNYV